MQQIDCGQKEMDIDGLSFFYGESIILDVANNTLCYPLQVLHKECMISQNPRDHNTRISYINSLNSSNAVSFDHVVVIPFRALSNLFHFAEGVNTIIRFVLQYKYPVIYNEWLYSVDSLLILVA